MKKAEKELAELIGSCPKLEVVVFVSDDVADYGTKTGEIVSAQIGLVADISDGYIRSSEFSKFEKTYGNDAKILWDMLDWQQAIICEVDL